eukprot:TRINITY_DN3210_c0_g1_i1.p1 TRINITY_DN3210_c0_g1~~TRINITY_DN3210_c0_g1_i1.p1  ORF type:complete len:464 (-),score=66.98 TRINITY_DN3210_c0_g1_i1:246-1637(-)
MSYFWGLWFLLGFLLSLLEFPCTGGYSIGIDYGQLGDNLPPPTQVIPLIQEMQIGRVKIYDANPKILKALANTNIKVSVMVPNEEIANISQSQKVADKWVKFHVARYYPETKINIVLVGNEILSDTTNTQTWYQLVPAMTNIRKALLRFKLKHIKVGTPSAMDVLNVSFPPSSGSFRQDIAESVMKPMLYFLNRTKSFFFLDVYPYFAWTANPQSISLDYATFGPNHTNYTDPNGLVYTNLLDQQLDAVISAMAKLGYNGIRLTIAETGWPNKGDITQWGANINNAANYNRRLVKKMLAEPPLGTPLRPKEFIPTYIFALFNEDLKPGPETERHWGVLYPNKTKVYDIDFTGRRPESSYEPLPPPPKPYKGKLWCVVDTDRINDSSLQSALNYACSQGNNTCLAIQEGRPCFQPNTLVNHCNYAFNRYWQQFKKSGGTCDFQGSAKLVTTDPSYGSCKFPYVR